ncbi:MAG: hypothetical protein AVO35_04515 [Candidatus Aegiribacteria sp. MLS_C]|nr:MAG: hypothetical protein AVO35_04515 [Candidatus Aegiribacteria sp. MLS_C]
MDWDGDGRLDIVVGDRLGNVYYFRRLSFGDIYLEQGPMVPVAGRPIHVGLNSAPSATDWNGDGLTDLVVGRMEGVPTGLFLYVNEGSAGQPLFSGTDTVTCGGEPIQLYASYPDFGDLDGDGLEDLIVGNTTGRIPCYMNSGTPEDPLFLEYSHLVADGQEINFTTCVRPSICDWNGDALPDLLASTWEGTIHLFLGLESTGTGPHQWEEGVPCIRLRNGNPAVAAVTLTISVRKPTPALVRILSIDGRTVEENDMGTLAHGEHRLVIDMTRQPSGTYFILLDTGGAGFSSAFVLLD